MTQHFLNVDGLKHPIASSPSMENGDWLSDYVLGILKSPTWVVPTMEFIDQNAILFDETEESTHEQMQCHQEFQELVTNLFLAHLAEVEITEEQFEAFIEVGLSTDGALHVHRVLAEQLLAAEDFLSFKAMMCKHNADLCHEVVTVEETTDPTSPSLHGLVSDVVQKSLELGLDEWQIYDAQKWQGSGPSTEEAEEARRKCEEAELQQAIALSLSIEEEKLRQLAVQELAQPEIPLPPSAGFVSAPLIHLPPKPFPEATPTTTAPPRLVPVAPMISKKPWGFTSAPLIPRPPAPPPPQTETETPVETVETPAPPVPAMVPRLPGRAGFTSSPLCIVPPKPRVLVQPHTSPPPPEESEPDSPLSPKSPGSPLSPGSLASLNHYRANLQRWKHRASLAVEPVPEALKEAQRRSRVLSDERLRADSGTSEILTVEDRQRRAEHLRRQRDKLLGKRRKEREEQLHEFTQALRPADGISLSQEDQAALGRRLVAELSGATLAESTALAPEAATQMRQALTRQLLQSLASSMHSDAATLEDRLNQLETMRWSSS